MFQYYLKSLAYISRSTTIPKPIRFFNSTEATTELNSTDQGTSKNQSNEENNDELVLVDRLGAVTVIGLNRSHKRNAINQKMALKICEAITNFENDDSSTVGVLHGVGGTFCSEYDIDDLQSETLKLENFVNSEGVVGPTRRIIKKPMVCNISGFCIANGLELALMCDIRVVEDDAILGFLNRRFGTPLLDGGTARPPAMIGLSRAVDLVLTGTMVTAPEAFRMGLANRIVETGTGLGKSVGLAKSIAKFPQASLLHDRNCLYSSAFENKNFDTSCTNEIMSLASKDVINEMKAGAAQFKSGIGRGGKSSNLKPPTMADWELEESRREKD